MTTSTSNGPLSASKKRSSAGDSRTRKRTRSSGSDQDLPGDESLSLRGGGPFTPAAGTWQPGTPASTPVKSRLFNNLGRSPVAATSDATPPFMLTTPGQAPREGSSAERQARKRGLSTVSQSSTGVGGGEDTPEKPAKVPKTTPRSLKAALKGLPTPGPTPKSTVRRDGGVAKSLSSGFDADNDWSYPDPRWNSDRQVIRKWKILEVLIADYVKDVLVDSIPDIDTTHLAYPYEALFRTTDLAGPIIRNEKYAKYIFQLSLWNILNVKFLGHMATEWACEEKDTAQWGQRTKGLASAIDLLTFQNSMDPKGTMLKRQREKWYMWRKDTVDIVYGWLSQNTDYEKTVENAIFDILSMYLGHFKPAFAGGDRKSWDNLVWRTTEVVAFAAQLGIIMRRSKDGTWSPFIPLGNVAVRQEAMMRHEDTAASLPPGQTAVKAGSKVTMTVVPGLCKYEMTNVGDDPAYPGAQNTAIRKKVRMKAKCLIDITTAQTGAREAGDIPVPEDI